MEFGEKVFVIQEDKVVLMEVKWPITHKGVVTGYEMKTHCDSPQVKFARKDVFTDEKKAIKALFVKNLKASEEKRVTPAEDKKGDRRWIKGHKRHRQ